MAYTKHKMTPKDSKILKTVELLVMLYDATLRKLSKLSELEQATLNISKQIILDAGLSVPEFTNAVNEISMKGYLWHVVFFDEKLRSEMDSFMSSPEFNKFLDAVKEKDTDEMSEKLKAALATDMQNMLPAGMELDQESVDEDTIKFSDVVSEGIEHYKKMGKDEIAVIILMPFRDIHTLHDKLNSGKAFDDIKDNGFWYDKDNYNFHIDGEIISTGKPDHQNLEHFVLMTLFSKPNQREQEYESIIGYDHSKDTDSYRDAMRRFVAKHHSLEKLFTPQKYKVIFHPERNENAP